MKTILEYLRLTLFVGGALIGVQIPSFVDQYGQRLESHFLESQTSLEGFQLDADRYFEGDIEKLIQHYIKKADPVISDGGGSIASLHSRAQFLKTSWSTFNAGIYQRYWHVLTAPVIAIRQEAWRSYGFTIKLDTKGIAWALTLGFLISSLIEVLLLTMGSIFSPAKRSKKRPI
jgi:hypothetical protein